MGTLFRRSVFYITSAAIMVGFMFFVTRMPGESYTGTIPPLGAEETGLRERLRGHVEFLAGHLGERNIWHRDNLLAAAGYIEAAFEELGHAVTRQEYTVHGVKVRNIVAVTGGSGEKDIVVVGAHYDTVLGTPGADDNASGVAALLELARVAAAEEYARPLHLVAFVNEEPPFFMTGDMGSVHYARSLKKRGATVAAMISLESIGFFSDEKGSQRYPFPFGFFYPDTADFIAFVGNLSSRGLVRGAIEVFRQSVPLPSEGTAAPGWVRGIGWSDHWAFWREGYPAIMVTDTAPFRNARYHTSRDVPETLDYDRLTRVVAGMEQVMRSLAGGHKKKLPLSNPVWKNTI